ncbi:MAG: hypothetical protein ACFFDR_05185 [Candidatus Thorarchaeota archaeon]
MLSSCTTSMQLIDLIPIVAFAVGFVILMMCAARSFGTGRPSGRVQVTRPSDKSVDGYGGIRGYDYSYSGQSSWGGDKPFPVGLRTERDKTDTHEAYKHDDDR